MNDITRALLAALHERYPVIAARLPLAIGIHQQLLDEGHDPALLRRVMSIHVKSVKYVVNMLKGGQRHHLDGSDAGEIEAEHVEFARQKVEELNRQTAEKVLLKKEQKSKLAASLAAKSIKPEPAPKPKPKPAAKPTPAVKAPPVAKSPPIVAVVVKKRRLIQLP